MNTENLTSIVVSDADIEILIDGLCALEDLDSGYIQKKIDSLKERLQKELPRKGK